MANYLVTDTELTSVANAIRTKGGTNAQLTWPTGFTTAIGDISTGGTKPNFTLTRDQSYRFAGSLGKDIIDLANFTTSELSNSSYMFSDYTGTTIPFAINYSSGQNAYVSTFQNCRYLTALPTINFNNSSGASLMYFNSYFYGCWAITTIPDGTFSTYDFTTMNNAATFVGQYMFGDCHSLTHIDSGLLPNLYCKRVANGLWRGLFQDCWALTDILDLGLFHPNFTSSYNMFDGTFSNCKSLSRLTFAANGAARSYSNQIIDLTTYVGYTSDVADSVYNHTSAVETINSLPDCSAVSLPSSPTNQIKFKAGSGANTVGGSISDLTAAEIEVATNKGWQVVIQ